MDGEGLSLLFRRDAAKILDSVKAGHTCIVVGSVKRGKSKLLRYVYDEIKHGHDYRAYNVLYHRLTDMNISTPVHFFRDLARDINDNLAPVDWRAVTDRIDYTQALTKLVQEHDHNIVYIVDNMQTLPPNLVQDLLGAIYNVVQQTHNALGVRLIVVLCGTIDIQVTAREEIQRFERHSNLNRIVLEDLQPDEAAALVALHCEEAQITVQPECLDTLFQQTGYDYYLIEQVVKTCMSLIQNRPEREINDALIREAIATFAQDFSPRDVLMRYFKRSKAVLNTAIRLLEPHTAKNGHRAVGTNDFYYLEMLRALFSQSDTGIRIKCPLWENLLRAHLTPLQIGRYFALHREWEEALCYLGRAYADGQCSADELRTTTLTALYASKTPDINKIKDDETLVRPQEAIHYLLLGLKQLYKGSNPTLYIGGVHEVYPASRKRESHISIAQYESAIGNQDYSVIRRKRGSNHNLILISINKEVGDQRIRGLVTLKQPTNIYGDAYGVWEHNQDLVSFLGEAGAALAIKQQKIDSMVGTARFMAKVNALFDVREFLHHNDLSEDLMLQLACHVISAGVGLGFNRVVFLMHDEQENQLVVKRAIGHMTYAEAPPDWVQVKDRFPSLKALCEYVIGGRGHNWEPKTLEKELLDVKMHLAPNAYMKVGRIEQRVNKAFKSGTKQHDRLKALHEQELRATPANKQRGPRLHNTLLSSTLLAQQRPGSEYLVLPLMVQEGKPIGVVYVDSMFNNNSITPQLTTLLETFLRQLALAIENRRNHLQRERETASLHHLLAVTQDTTGSTTNIQALAQKVVQHAAELLNADSAVLYSVRSPRESSHPEDQNFVKAYPLDVDVEQVDNLGTTGKIRSMVRRQSELIIDSLDDDKGNAQLEEYADIRESKFIREQQIKCFVGTRLGEGDEDLGVLYVNWKSPDQLNPEKLNLLRVYKEVATQALQNAQITRRYSERADSILDALVTATRSTEEENEKLKTQVFEDLRQAYHDMHPKPLALHLYLAEAENECTDFSINGAGIVQTRSMKHADIPPVALKAFQQRALYHDTIRETGSAVGYPLEVDGNTVAVLYAEYGVVPHTNNIPQPEFLKDFSATQYHITRLDISNFYQAQRKILKLISEKHRLESEDQIPGMLDSLTSIMMHSSRTVDAISLYYMDREPSLLRLGGLQGFNDPEYHRANWAQDETMLLDVLSSKRPLLTHEDESYLLDNGVATREDFKACALVPLRINDRRVGCIFFNYRYPHEFSDAEKQQMLVLGQFAATAIYQMTLLRMLNDLSDFARSINENLEPEEVLKKLLTQVRNVTGAHNVAIVEQRADGQLCIEPLNLNKDDNQGRPFYFTDNPPEHDKPYVVPGGASLHDEPQTLAGWVIQNITPVRLSDVNAPHGYPYHRANKNTQSELVVPIIRDNKCTAAIVLESDHKDAFSEEDEKWVIRLAEHAGIAMQNAEMQVQVVLHMLHNMSNAVRAAYGFLDAVDANFKAGQDITAPLMTVWQYIDEMNNILGGLTARRSLSKKFYEDISVKSLLDKLHRKVKLRNIDKVYMLDRSPKQTEIKGDDMLLPYALWNIIINGYEALQDKFGEDSAYGAVRIKTYVKQDRLYVLITDNGCGIKKVNGGFNYIFRSGYTTKNAKRPFAGEGLSTFIKIIHAHGGKYTLYSRIGWGTCFKIVLPLIGGTTGLQ